MDYQTVDSTFVDRLASKDFDPQEFVREIVSESIGDSDVLANKVKLQAFAERTARSLRDSVTRNYSKFLTTADEVALLEDEMYHLRSLSNHYKAVMNFLKDFIIREEIRDMQTEKSASMQRKTAESYGNDAVGSADTPRSASKKDDSQMLTSLSILIDQAQSIGLISPWPDDKLRRYVGDKDKKLLENNEQESPRTSDETAINSSPALVTDDGRRLIHQAHLTMMDPDTLLEKTHLQFFLLDGCILLCTSAPLRQDTLVSTPGPTEEPPKAPSRSTRLNLLTAIDVDSLLSVTDVKDSTELSKLGGASFRNTFKLAKRGREIFILRATSAQSKAACVQSISSYLEQITEFHGVGGERRDLTASWSSALNGGSSEGTDVILSFLSDQLSQLQLAICHRQQNLAEELILHCRQRLSNLPSGIRATSEGSQIDLRLNQLEQKLVRQIRNGPRILKDRGRGGQGLRDPKREINLLKRLGYNSDAIELFIGYQRMSFPTQRRFDSMYGGYSPDSVNWSMRPAKISPKQSENQGIVDQRSPVSDTVGKYNESFSDTLQNQIELELNNRIALFFDSIRRAEQNFYDNFCMERTECASTFLVWLGAEIDANIDNILYEAYGTKESADGCWVLGRIAEVVKMLSDGASSMISCDSLDGNKNDTKGRVDSDVANKRTLSRRLDIMFLIEEKLASVVKLAIREDKQKHLDIVRSWGRSESPRLTSQPLQLVIRCVNPPDHAYTSRLVSPPTFLLELMNLAPEIVDSLNRLITVSEGKSDDHHDTSSLRRSLVTTEGPLGQAQGYNAGPLAPCVTATLNLTYCTIVFSKLLLTFARQCFAVYMERTKSTIVESIVELVKLYLRFLGQMFNQAVEGFGQETANLDISVASVTSGEKLAIKTGVDAEFIYTNIEFVVSVLFVLVDNWFQRLTGNSSKHFVKLYEKLERYKKQIQAHRQRVPP